MTEGLLLTDIDRAGVAAADATANLGVCVGRPIDGVELALAPIDDSGASADVLEQGVDAQGHLGEFVVSAAHIKSGYDNLSATTTAASARDDLDGRTWHRTNDIGHIDAEGRIWLEGRLQHVVTTPRGPVGPGGLEALIDSDEQVSRSSIVGIGPAGTQSLVAVLDAEGTELSPGLAPLDLSRAPAGTRCRHCRTRPHSGPHRSHIPDRYPPQFEDRSISFGDLGRPRLIRRFGAHQGLNSVRFPSV